MKQGFLVISMVCLVFCLHAQHPKSLTLTAAMRQQLTERVDRAASGYQELASQIWNLAEPPFQEIKSSMLLMEKLKTSGFIIEYGVASLPTAFSATYGNGTPVIGILAAYDAAPGISQQAIPERAAMSGKTSGHSCGHNLSGAAAVAAAITLQQWMAEQHLAGTIKVFGCPASEESSGKAVMAAANAFAGVDAMLDWHPADCDTVVQVSTPSAISIKFTFAGNSAHAVDPTKRARSALDGVEATVALVNQMGEHLSSDFRIHHVITAGGKAPHIIPDIAEVQYTLVHPKRDQVLQLAERLTKIAQAAAQATETSLRREITGGVHEGLVNTVLSGVVQRNLMIGDEGVYDEADRYFATTLSASLVAEISQTPSKSKGNGFTGGQGRANLPNDVGDVSYQVPVAQFETLCWVPGTAAYSWQAVAASGSPFGYKGMLKAVKILVFTALDLLMDPEVMVKAKQEWLRRKGGYQYSPLFNTKLLQGTWGR